MSWTWVSWDCRAGGVVGGHLGVNFLDQLLECVAGGIDSQLLLEKSWDLGEEPGQDGRVHNLGSGVCGHVI